MATSENGTEHAADNAESVSTTNIVQPYFKWTDVNTEKLIELFKSFPCLYDTTKENHDRNKKKSAQESISASLGKYST